MTKHLHHFFYTLGIILMLCSGVQESLAVIAKPGVTTVKQPDGTTVSFILHGDEFFSYRTTKDGYVIAQNTEGYYCYASFNTGKLVVSDIRVGQQTKGTSAVMVKGVPDAVAMSIRQSGIARTQESAPTQAVMPPKGLVIMAEYTDIKFQPGNIQAKFSALLNQPNYTQNGAIGSAKEYFSDNSMGKYSPDFVVTKVVTLPKNRAYYGENDATGRDMRPDEMIYDACKAAALEGINFAEYDSDKDGIVDNVFVFYAGHNEAERGPMESIWPHRFSIANKNLTLNGVRLKTYACTSELRASSGSEMAGIATFCHEFGHVLSLPDLYDTDYAANGQGKSLHNSLSIMSSGVYNNDGKTPPYYTSIEREFLGWLEPTEITESKNYTLDQIHKNVVYKIPTSNPGEYFLLENRSRIKWDAYIGGTGMLVYHIDKSSNDVFGKEAAARWDKNTLNAYAYHECANVVEAPGPDYQIKSQSELFFPGSKSITSLSYDTHKSYVSWGLVAPRHNLTNINLGPDGKITFTATIAPVNKEKALLKGIIKNYNGDPMSGVEINLSPAPAPVKSLHPYVMVSYVPNGNNGYKVQTTGDGAFLFEDIAPGNYTVNVVSPKYYNQYLTTKQLNKGENLLDITLYPSADNPEFTELKWHNGTYNNVGYSLNSPAGFHLAAYFSAADLAKYPSRILDKVSIYTGPGATKVALTVINGTDVIHTQSITKALINGWTAFDFSDKNLTFDKTKELRFNIKFTDNLTGGAIVWGIDSNPVPASSKGDLGSSDGKTWEHIGYNALITGHLRQADINNPLCIIANRGQRDVIVSWDKTTNVTQWQVKCSLPDGTPISNQTVQINELRIEHLTPGTSYVIEVTPKVTGGTASKLNFSTEFTSSQFAVIALTKSEFAVAEKALLRINNVNSSYKSIVWKVNSTLVETPYYTFTKAGKYIISAEITNMESKTETITRTITVN